MTISWTQKKSNEEVMEMAGYKRSLLKTIKRQLQFLWAYKPHRWTRKANIEWKYLMVPKAEKDNAYNTQTV